MAEDKKFTIPSIVENEDMGNHNLLAAEQWKLFFSQQKIIRVATTRQEIQEIMRDQSIRGIACIVEYPISFAHLEDFINEIPAACGYAMFWEDGAVTADHFSECNYTSAWEQILSRVNGKGITRKIPGISLESITTTIEAIQKMSEQADQMQSDLGKVKEHLKVVVAAFDKIPSVNAEIHQGADSDRLITVTFETCFPSEQERLYSFEFWGIYMDGTIEVCGGDGEQSATYKKWKEGVEADQNLTLQKFYEHALRLGKIYSAIPEFVPVEE